MRKHMLCWWVGLGVVSAMVASGCGESTPVASNSQPAATSPTQAAPSPSSGTSATQVTAAKPKDSHAPETVSDGDFHHQPFQSAIRPTMPDNALPPLSTATGKSVGKLYSAVQAAWPDIRFTTATGQKLRYTATIHTDLGPIEMELLSEVAPNHVRSFIALARAGYFDGLFFEHRVGNPDDPNAPRAIAGGSPEANGNDLGSIGYWLQPEILLPEAAAQRNVLHKPGIVGAVHAFQQLDTAACRFYICLSDAPMWDGEYTIFGRVTRGLDVASRIYAQPANEEPGSLALFEKLPVIHKVTISCVPLENSASKSENE